MTDDRCSPSLESSLLAVSKAHISRRCVNIEQQLEEFIKNDDASSLLSLLCHWLRSSSSNDNTSSSFCLSELLIWVCRYRAVNCAAMLIGGHVGEPVALNAPLRDGLLPLFHAVHSLSYYITWIFIKCGARTDVRCSPLLHKFNGLLPISVAAESLSYYIEWTPKESVFKLVLILCLPELNEALETIRLLAKHTLPELVEDVIFQYAGEGKLIEFAVLLMVVTENHRLLYFFDMEKKISLHPMATIRKCIAAEIASLSDMEFTLVGGRSRKLFEMCAEKKRSMMSMMLLFKIYERLGCFLAQVASNYIASKPEHVALVFEKMGFTLKNEHFQVSRKEDCFSAVLPWEQLGCRESRSQPEYVCLPSYMQACSLPITKKPKNLKTPQQSRSISTLSLFRAQLCPQVPKLERLKGFGPHPCCSIVRTQTGKTSWSEILRLSSSYLAFRRRKICIRGH